MAKQTAKVQSLSAFVWSIAEILRGDFKQSEYGKVVLPFVVLRRLDCDAAQARSSLAATGTEQSSSPQTGRVTRRTAAASCVSVSASETAVVQPVSRASRCRLHASTICCAGNLAAMSSATRQ